MGLSYQFYNKGMVRKSGEGQENPSAAEIIDVGPKTSTHYDFYFYSATTDSSITATTTNTSWVSDYRANGFTSRQVYYNDSTFSKSYFKLDFYDSKKSTTQQNLLTIIIPTQQDDLPGQPYQAGSSASGVHLANQRLAN